MAELTIYTASHSLQGAEIRNSFDHKFAELYHDLDMGFSPINFMLSWAPLPHNRARDNAHEEGLARHDLAFDGLQVQGRHTGPRA
jgi:hypothetical protein